jgi:hypothetical protein
VFLGTASPQNRGVLIDWLYQVHDRFKLLSDTFHMTIHLIDRYLQKVDVSKQELQLIGSTGTNKISEKIFLYFYLENSIGFIKTSLFFFF